MPSYLLSQLEHPPPQARRSKALRTRESALRKGRAGAAETQERAAEAQEEQKRSAAGAAEAQHSLPLRRSEALGLRTRESALRKGRAGGGERRRSARQRRRRSRSAAGAAGAAEEKEGEVLAAQRAGKREREIEVE